MFVFLQGIEDYAGDMDFKLAGTKSGVTALQVFNIHSEHYYSVASTML